MNRVSSSFLWELRAERCARWTSTSTLVLVVFYQLLNIVTS